MSELRPTVYSDNWGELIRAHRMFLGLSQRTMSEKLKIGEKSLSDIEVGRRQCPPGFLDSVELVADQFDADVESTVRLADLWSRDRDGATMDIEVSNEPGDEWKRAVVGRAAVESGRIMPILVGKYEG